MKYFVISDMHGDFTATVSALQDSGYDQKNPEHTLIVLGDYFGRADTSPFSTGSKQIYDYLLSPDHLNKPICIKGNHEILTENIFRRGYIHEIDFSNGDEKTIISFSEKPGSIFDVGYQEDMIRQASESGLREWIKTLPWFYETKTHILTHGWFPQEILPSSPYATWDDAIWSRTEDVLRSYKKDTDKTLVVGHWSAALLRRDFQYDGSKDVFGIYKWENVVVVDTTTVLSHKVAVYIFEE